MAQSIFIYAAVKLAYNIMYNGDSLAIDGRFYNKFNAS